MSTFHTPVLLQEVIEYLNVQNDHKYIDATIGGGGHAQEILKKGGLVLGIDQDTEALEFCKNWLGEEYKNRIIFVKANFRYIDQVAKKYGFSSVSGILLDLGISSYQLDTAKRGFSFKKEAKLDMRMNKEIGTTALEIINKEPFETLYKIFLKYGEEPEAENIAKTIIHRRGVKQISTTKELADIVFNVYCKNQAKDLKIHPATRVFQALRIAVNDELNALKEGIENSLKLLNKGGRLAVISYHSLEDRIVKLSMRNKNLGLVTKKPITASREEIRVNRRARSAKLRIAQKI